MHGQDGSAGTISAHGQQLIQATVAVHKVTTKEDHGTLDTMGFAVQLGLGS
jgi:hypothetical protein